MYELFFQLIRVAVGLSHNFPKKLSSGEWRRLYELANRQSVVGIGFAGVQELCDSDSGDWRGMSENLYYSWMAAAARINKQNETLSQQGVSIYNRLLSDGMASCLLKGQGVASYYGKLQTFRQSGDIDLWLMPAESVENGQVTDSLNKRRCLICKYCRSTLPEYDRKKEGKMHTSYQHFADTDTEIHFTPSTMSNPNKNNLLQSWFESQWKICSSNIKGGIPVPTVQFDLVYLLLHIYRHALFEGIGLRQIMDYYFVTVNSSEAEREEAYDTIQELGAEKFASGLVWVMRHVLKLDPEFFICEPDKRYGELLLEIIEEGGNFGHHSKYHIKKGASKFRRFVRYVTRNTKLICYYPNEIIWHFRHKVRRFFSRK